jgi:hypothetical protein
VPYRATAALAIVLMLCALVLPAYMVPWESDPDETYAYRGFDALIFGWAAVFSGINFAWLANPPWLWGAARLVRGLPPNLWASLLGVALSAFALESFDAFRLDDTAGDVARPTLGATLFVASNVVVALAAIVAQLLRLQAQPSRQ